MAISRLLCLRQHLSSRLVIFSDFVFKMTSCDARDVISSGVDQDARKCAASHICGVVQM